MTPPTATTTQLAVLEQLPSPVRLEALEWDAALRTLSPPVGKALARLAAQFGCDAVTARRRYDRWRRHGVLGTVNAARAGVRLRDLLRGSAHVHRQSIAKNPAFAAYAKALSESYQRKTRPAWRRFAADWKNGRQIPGLDNTLPRHELPPGCGLANWMRITRDAFAQEAMRRGLGRATARFGPQILSTRANLWYGSHLMIDDIWHDNFVVFGNQLVRVLELDALDVFSGYLEDFGCKPRVQREDGSFENIREKYTRLLVAKVFHQRGYSPRGSTILAEHGTASISERARRVLHDTSGGMITVRDSGITGEEQVLIGWRGQGRGNPRFKAALESLRNLKHNELAALPAQTGLDREHRPEATHGLLAQASEELKALAVLAARNPARASQMRLRLLDYHADFLPLLLDVYRAINERTWHTLEGWDKITGNVVIEYRTAPDAPQFLSDAQFRALPNVSQELILAAAATDPRFLRRRRLSPAEVKARDGGAIVRLPAWAVVDLIGEDFARELAVRGAYFRPFADRELSPEPLLFESRLLTLDGRVEQLRDDTYMVFVNPFDLDQLFVCDARLRCLGVAPRAARIDAHNEPQLRAAFGHRARRLAELQAPIRARHATAVRAELDRINHNAALFAAEIETETNALDEADEALRLAMQP